LPIEWFFSDGVVLNLRHKKPGEKISVQDLEGALRRIGYALKPLDIVMIVNGRDRGVGSTEYFEQPSMTRESTLWLVEQGIKVIGVDPYGFDRRFEDMAREFRETGDGRVIWEAHFAGIERGHCQIEKLANLVRSRAPPASRSPASPQGFKAPAEASVGPWRLSNVDVYLVRFS
jgi:kynurenine formamidase